MAMDTCGAMSWDWCFREVILVEGRRAERDCCITWQFFIRLFRLSPPVRLAGSAPHLVAFVLVMTIPGDVRSHVRSHGGFRLHIPADGRRRAPFHVLVGPLSSLERCLVRSCAHFSGLSVFWSLSMLFVGS